MTAHSTSDPPLIPVHSPSFGPREAEALRRCIDAGNAGGHSPIVAEFESAFAAYVGSRHAVATSNGTAALHLAFTALGIGPGDEVIVPSFSFAPCADMVSLTGATPVLVDSDPVTLNLSTEHVERAITYDTRAVLAVHMYGRACDLSSLARLCAAKKLQLVEDCAQGLGARHAELPVGAFGTVACYSFYANKVITTGEGGMVTTDDDALAAEMRRLRSHAQMRGTDLYVHDRVGFNHRMNAFGAAVGLVQLRRIDEFLSTKAANADRYANGLRDLDGIRLPAPVPPGDRHANWAYAILVDDAVIPGGVETLATSLRLAGCETRRFYQPLHLHPDAEHRSVARGDLRSCEDFAPAGLVLPSGNSLTKDQVDRIVDAIHLALRRP